MALISRSMAPTGAVRATVFRGNPPAAGTIWHAVRLGLPTLGLSSEVFRYRVRNLPYLLAGAWRLVMGALFGVPMFWGVVSARVRRAATGLTEDYGVLSTRVVTNNGVAFLVDALDNTVEAEIMKYHGCGTTNTAEAVGDSALVAESTTILNPDSTRATGTQSQPAANVHRSVGLVTFDGVGAIVEHGLFSQAATGGGVLFDRSVFSVINVGSGDSIQFTYELTLTAGS